VQRVGLEPTTSAAMKPQRSNLWKCVR